MMNVQKILQTNWRTIPIPKMYDIPISTTQGRGQEQLISRLQNYGGAKSSTKWMNDLISSNRASWRSVRDPASGHTIHVISDRPFKALTQDLELGLRILAFMSSKTPITWFWWDQQWNRILPPNVTPSQQHLNGGWAIPGVPEVHVYRNEEAHKVLIHECIHALNLDVSGPELDTLRTQLDTNLNPHTRLNPHIGEAFTELYAEYIWSALFGNWALQVKHSKRQASEIWARIRSTHENEDTSVFAYYILKWILMNHIDVVLLSPQASISLWYRWWIQLRPQLDRDSNSLHGSVGRTISLRMTPKG